MNCVRSKLIRTLLIMSSLVATTALLVADGTRRCDVEAQSILIRMLPPCAAVLRVDRDRDNCWVTIQSDSESLELEDLEWIPSYAVDLTAEDFSFRALRLRSSDHETPFEGVVCSLDPSTFTYTCEIEDMSQPETSWTVACQGRYEVVR